jgi:hypothetical protein
MSAIGKKSPSPLKSYTESYHDSSDRPVQPPCINQSCHSPAQVFTNENP